MHEGIKKAAQVQLRCQKPRKTKNEELENKEQEAFEGWGEAERVKMWYSKPRGPGRVVRRGWGG